MWKTTMLRKQCFSNVKKTWNRLCRVDIMSKQLCTSVDSAKQPDNKDWFLYLNMCDRLCRLNIRDFCEKQGSCKEPKFELIHDYYPGYPKNTIPTRMKPVIVGSKVYMWGGASISVKSDEGEMRQDYVENLNVYSFDPSASPPFRLCEGPISRLVPPNCDNYFYRIKVFNIEEKIYVLDLPHIRVFDPVNQSWRDLPDCPCLPDTNPSVRQYIFCGHKLIINTCDGSYMFDTREENWENKNNISCDVMEEFRSTAIEFKGYLILVTRDTYYKDMVVAYKLDSNGIPNVGSYQVLHEITRPHRWSGKNYMGKCGDGRIWLVSTGGDDHDYYGCMITYLTVFHVSVSNDTEGNQTLSVEIIAQRVPSFEPSNYCWSVFALCHDADKIESQEKLHDR